MFDKSASLCTVRKYNYIVNRNLFYEKIQHYSYKSNSIDMIQMKENKSELNRISTKQIEIETGVNSNQPLPLEYPLYFLSKKTSTSA